MIVFAAIGVAGLLGTTLAGWLADRVGRTITTSIAMFLSEACCLVSPAIFAAPTGLLVAVLMIWGASVNSDSAQFSAAVTELAKPPYACSALTLQLALGFALTIASLRLVPVAADVVGWRFALVPLAAGPLLGTAAMLRLRTLTAARRLAHGRPERGRRHRRPDPCNSGWPQSTQHSAHPPFTLGERPVR